jgi:membrane-associated phospholipid phosphatase
MQYLRQTSLHSAVNISTTLQEVLWQYHVSGGIGVGAGISAMPSMHVAGAMLFALLGWRTNRFLGIALTINVALILMATVFLGWHYAVDGYASIVGTLVIWWAVGALIRRASAPSEARAAAVPVL